MKGNKPRIINPGDKFNYLTFIREDYPVYAKNGNKRRYGIFRCDCGNEKRIRIHSVTSSHIVSCGCYCRKMASNVCKIRNTTHGLSKHPLFNRWLHIKGRCLNPKDKRYKDYGGRGIDICKEWKHDFIEFYNWCMANGYDKTLQLDRTDNDRGYAPSNCRFVTNKQNCNNTRRNIIVNIEGSNMTLMEACEYMGIEDKYRTIWDRVKTDKDFLNSIKK